MRWSRREQSTVLLKLAVPLLLLIPAAVGFQPARSHPVETCPVNPFQALGASLVCSVKQNVTTVPIQDDDSTCFKSEAALPSTTDAPKGNSPHQDDRRLSEAMTVTSSSSSSIIEPTTSSALISTPSSTARTDKEVAWSEIDDSLGLSWTPELEIEYANAQRDFELHTQAVASNVQTSIPSADEVRSRSEGNSALPEFPSFAEWKERHLAASIAAGTHSSKENAESRANRDKDLKKNISVDTGKVAQKSTSSKHDLPPADPLQVLRDENGQAAAEAGTENSNELAAHSRRIIHPAPHAGTGDPLLDPLVSLRDRTNYASFDCSATLIRSSKSTKSASAILSSKKDRYMLTPCAEKEKYVIVELCDEIQIDTIVLANLEFFSSMFKLFRVSGGTAYPESAGTWRDIGTFRASNARGMQVREIRPQTWLLPLTFITGLPPVRAHRRRLLPISSHRLPLTLWLRILLSRLVTQSLRPDTA